MHSILLYYKYILLENPEMITGMQKTLCQKLNLKGRIIIAKEGINGTVEGLDSDIATYMEETRKIPEFADIQFKISKGTGNSFPKLSVKTRKEIVTLGRPNLFPKPGETGGNYLSPDELHSWFEKKDDFVILDMRNEYEFQAGKFDNSVVMPVRYFRDIPEHAETLQKMKDKKVVAVCTGGVRCEKGTTYLKEELGFKNVYQLHEGIVTYMDKYPQGHFKGSLYVFDNRMTMRSEGMPEIVLGKCEQCGTASEQFVNCSLPVCRKQSIFCDACIEKFGGREKCVCREHEVVVV